jgi:Tfx family DNA-binding protein
MKRGSLTEVQFRVLTRRGKGMTQKETARELGTTRANVSMIELRARRKVQLARDTIRAYQSTLEQHIVLIPKGTRFYDIPPTVLREGDRRGIHIQSNIVDIVRMVQAIKPSCIEGGRTKRGISFVFNPAGKLRVGSPEG